jgi:hypothetical protein
MRLFHVSLHYNRIENDTLSMTQTLQAFIFKMSFGLTLHPINVILFAYVSTQCHKKSEAFPLPVIKELRNMHITCN